MGPVRPHAFDRYVGRESPVHRLDPRAKTAAALLFILSNALLPDGAWAAYGLSFALVLLVGALAGLGPGYPLLRSMVALPFALAALTAVFVLPGPPLLALSLGPWQLVATEPGAVRFLSIVVRSLLSVQMAILLTATTPFPELLHALRHLGVPSLLVTIVSLMYRYLFVLADEATRLLRAREARSAAGPGGGHGGSLTWRAGVAGHMVGQLFLRSYERSDRVYQAMLARGMDGRHATLNPHAMRRRDWVAGLGALATLALIQAAGRI
jgi:cobalt/nickel transport system permease protein